MVTATFGDMLYVPRSEYLNGFPSPESLRRRILISTKPPEHTKGESIKEKPSADKQRDTADDDIWESVQQQQDMDEVHIIFYVFFSLFSMKTRKTSNEVIKSRMFRQT